MNLFDIVNHSLRNITGNDFWNILECYAGIGVIITSLMQRSWINVFSVTKSNASYFVVKVGQIGLYIQTMMGLFAIIDSYFSQFYNDPHCLMAIWCVGIVFTKYAAYLHETSKKN